MCVRLLFLIHSILDLAYDLKKVIVSVSRCLLLFLTHVHANLGKTSFFTWSFFFIFVSKFSIKWAEVENYQLLDCKLKFYSLIFWSVEVLYQALKRWIIPKKADMHRTTASCSTLCIGNSGKPIHFPGAVMEAI